MVLDTQVVAMLLEGAKTGKLVQQIWCLAQHSSLGRNPFCHLDVMHTSGLCNFD